MMRLIPVLAAATLLAGCLQCQPLLEVRHCLPDKCDPSPDAAFVEWGAAEAATWPDVDAVIQRTVEGKHTHHEWTRSKEDAFWAHFGVSGDQPELHATLQNDTYRIRVLTCD